MTFATGAVANRGRLRLRTPGPVLFGVCICSGVETILSWACHANGPFEFPTSLSTSILLISIPDEELFSETYVRYTASYFV